ncbi:MAG TPA: acetate/propionate family kinase [Bryobacteraceae bacterium]|nr:acetate/propionate family kinase [Bryobacteraceae bacterium]
MRILVLNGGSSSFKCALYDLPTRQADSASRPEPLWKEHTDWTGAGSPAEALEPVLRRAGDVELVGHRIVHAGVALRTTAWITDEVRSAIAQNAEIAPAHNRFELEAIDVTARVMGPGVRQVAVVDTAFHAGLEPAAYVYPGPYEWLEQEGIRRFGFHGISYQYATRRAAQLLGRMPARMLVCHLGSGASLCAVRDGASVDTTMGFTPLEGLMMSSRSGSLDPGIIVYLLRHRGYSAEDLDQILNKESGLMGVSGFSGDMRTVLHRRELGDPRARLAFDVYMRRLTREAGAMVAVLGGLDALVFTGGVGEGSPLVRQAVCDQFGFLGLRLDAARNAQPAGDGDVAAPGSLIPVLVIHAEEEWEIARECWRLAGESEVQ